MPSFLDSLQDNFDAQFDKWHVVLADERCVPSTHDDSNLGSLQRVIGMLASQIHGINQAKLNESNLAIAQQHELLMRDVMNRSDGLLLDLAVLGFGPDGHTCSLFWPWRPQQEHLPLSQCAPSSLSGSAKYDVKSRSREIRIMFSFVTMDSL